MTKLFTCCPSCGAALDYDTDTHRSYECGTLGDFDSGHYIARCMDSARTQKKVSPSEGTPDVTIPCVMYDFVERKKVHVRELESSFTEVKRFSITGELTQCGNCKDEINTMKIPAEAWTSALYCWRCSSITVVIHHDAMGGFNSDTAIVYR